MTSSQSPVKKNNSDQLELLSLLEAREQELKYNKLKYRFPKTGPYRKELYAKHIEFMYAGKKFMQRLFVGANRVGKTETGGTEFAYHLTGLYPDDWKGRVFLNPVSTWCVGIKNSSVKEIMQKCLLGPLNDIGSGLIPRECILAKPTMKQGASGCVDSVLIKHKSGGVSELFFKSYEEGREAFQGTKKDVIWLDEEPRDYGIYEECLMRLMDDTAPGIIYMTFTPLFGVTNLVKSFLPGGRMPDDGTPPDDPSKFAIQIAWDDFPPHLDEKQKELLMASIAPHLRGARTKGIPTQGVGAIYPHNEEDILIKPFEIPQYWPKAYGLDVGWKKTAAIWITMNPDTNQYFLYSEHYEGGGLPVIHASAIKARGDWILGVIDTGSKQVSPTDGKCLWDQYINEGLNIIECTKAKEASILKINQMLASGQLKVFNTLQNWLSEFRTYSRDEDGKISDRLDDHLMDAMNYLVLACPDIMRVAPDYYEKEANRFHSDNDRDDITGY